MSYFSRALSSLFASVVLAAGALSLATTPAVAAPQQREICVPIPGLPCVPDIPGTPGIPLLEPPTATTPTAITGTPKVGQTLTATEPTWSPEAETTYQWQRAGSPIADATAQTYKVQQIDIAKSITVVATGTVALNPLFPGESTSAPVIGVIGDAITASVKPAITGTPAVAQTLTVKPGTWPGEPVPTFKYQWYRSSGGSASVISGATGTTYAPTSSDLGRKLAVVVTATRPGYTPGTAASNTIQLPKAASTTTLALIKKKITAGTRAKARITLSAAGGTPTGKVALFDGTRRVKTYLVSATGPLTVMLPQLAAGTHRLTARYLGDSSRNASQSKTVTLTVIKKKG